MQVIALPGRNSATEAWLRSVLSVAALPDDGLVRYRHWESDVEPSVDFEASRLTGQTPSLVVAKSLGTLIAATAFDRYNFRPNTVVLIGTPYQPLAQAERRLLQQLARGVSTLFVQQTEDPGGSAAELLSALDVSGGEVTAVLGSDHLYTDTVTLGEIIKRWVQKHA
jgi:predicted alpha/beta-hydrolase family hydrolase